MLEFTKVWSVTFVSILVHDLPPSPLTEMWPVSSSVMNMGEDGIVKPAGTADMRLITGE